MMRDCCITNHFILFCGVLCSSETWFPMLLKLRESDIRGFSVQKMWETLQCDLPSTLDMEEWGEKWERFPCNSFFSWEKEVNMPMQLYSVLYIHSSIFCKSINNSLLWLKSGYLDVGLFFKAIGIILGWKGWDSGNFLS